MKNLRDIFYIWENANRITFNQEAAYQCILDGDYDAAYERITSLIKEEVEKISKDLNNQPKSLY